MKQLKEKDFVTIKRRLMKMMETQMRNGNGDRKAIYHKIKNAKTMKEIREIWDDDDYLRELI